MYFSLRRAGALSGPCPPRPAPPRPFAVRIAAAATVAAFQIRWYAPLTTTAAGAAAAGRVVPPFPTPGVA